MHSARAYAKAAMSKAETSGSSTVGRRVNLRGCRRLAADLVDRRVSLMVATGGTVGPNPIGDGLVTSLNRPGGNATGVALYTSDLLPKRLELLEKLLPRAARI